MAKRNIDHRKWFQLLGNKLGFKSYDDWYDLSPQKIIEEGGRGILSKYKMNLAIALKQSFPEYDWKMWKFSQSPRNYLNDKAVQLQFLEEMKEKLNIKQTLDWYTVDVESFSSAGGRALLRLYKESLFQMLSALYPKEDWKPWLFKKAPKDFWSSKENQRKYIDWLGKKLGIEKMEHWYQLSASDLVANQVFPEYEWLPWRFKHARLHASFWLDKQIQRKYLEWLGKHLQLKDMEAYYTLTATDILDNGGNGLLALYENKVTNLIMEVFKNDYNWNPELFRDKQIQREFLINLSKQLGIKTWEDWYKVKQQEFVEKGGGNLLRYHNGSHLLAIISTFPGKFYLKVKKKEYNWEPWKFSKVPHGFWDEVSNIKVYMNAVAKQLNITKPDDWYNVSAFQMVKLKSSSLFVRHGGLIGILKKAYPDHPWDYNLLKNLKAKNQYSMFRAIGELFPNVSDIHNNYPHPDLKFSSGKLMELDVFIPSLKLAFEYQGEQHFFDVESMPAPSADIRIRDAEKREACKLAGITLLEIPYWWDLSKESLQATIHQARPDVIAAGSKEPIPLSPE